MYSPLRFLPSIIKKGRPLHLTFFVTRKCNARCPFCFYLESEDAPVTDSELAIDEIEKISRSMGDLLWVAFSGGEIFLRKDLAEVSRIFYENNRPSILLYPTNGLMPGRIRDTLVEILNKCPKSIITVKLSMDGIGDRHDRLRGMEGSFDKVMQTYETLGPLLDKYDNFELGINTVFCSDNQDEMDDIITFVKGLSMIKTHTISLVRGNLANEAFKDVYIEKYLDAIEKIEQNLKDGTSPTYRFGGAKIKAAQDIIQRRLIHRTVKENERQLPCYAGRLNVVLTETGEVFPCENFNNSFNLGNARDCNYNILSLLKNVRARNIITRIKENCFCTHECYMMTNILFNAMLYPGLLREVVQIA